jgi:2-iminoacetate synthase ThiH
MYNVNIIICTAYCNYCVFNGRRAKNPLLRYLQKMYVFKYAQVIKIHYDIIRVTHFHSSMTSILNSEV